MKIPRRVVIFILFFGIAFQGFAQKNGELGKGKTNQPDILQYTANDYETPKTTAKNNWYKNGWSGFFGIGGNQLYGDINDEIFFSKLSGGTRFAWTLGVSKNLHPLFDARLQMKGGGMESSKKKFKNNDIADLTVKGNIFDISLNFTADLNKLFWGYENERKLTIYPIVGFGISSWQTDLKDTKTGYLLGSSGETNNIFSKRVTSSFLCYGLGMAYKINSNWDFFLETTQQWVHSDKVDITEGGINNDMYQFLGVGLVYCFSESQGFNSLKHNKNINNNGTYRIYSSEKGQNLSNVPQLMEFGNPGKPTATKKLETEKEPTKQIPSEILSDNAIRLDNYNGTLFAVQILAAKEQMPLHIIIEKFEITEKISEEYSAGYYRYYAGVYTSYREAELLCKQLKHSKVPDAFIVAFVNGKRVAGQKVLKK
ncbi:MAG: SPOR domain-containing protein [Lentimicrobiaceae bacterium]|nr:SPOR domain-containing protein [Lentimicrobiaceae bacterium]